MALLKPFDRIARMPSSAIRRKARTLLIGAVLYVAVVIVTTFLHQRIFHPHVLVDAQGAVNLEFLQPGLISATACEEAAAGIADTIRVACPACRVATRECLRALTPGQAKLLSSEPVDVPVSRLPRGVVAYSASDKDLALAACRESERLSASDHGSLATCFPPGAARARTGTLPPTPSFGMWQTLIGFLLLALTGVTAALAGFLILRYEALHARWTHDHTDAGPQKFHATPTPRIGGLGVMTGLLVSVVAVLAAQSDSSSESFGYLVLASLPAFLGGIVEDITKNVGVPVRLALTMLAAALGAWLLGAIIPRLDVPGLDALLRWAPFGIAFTMFAVGGVANAINIIDGYNGLAAGHAVIVLAAMACVSVWVGDSFLFTSALAMIGALLGFLVWNYPKGKIFLGDGGAYLLGFWLGELSVLLVVRHPEISPWFPLLLLVFPIFETVFSMYRRRIILGMSPGQPDRFHMHQVIYASLPGGGTSSAAELTHRNSRVAPYFWMMTLCCAVPAVLLWRDTTWLVSAAVIFCVGYVLLYRRLRPDSGGG